MKMFKKLSSKEKWTKEIIGIPTYVGASILGMILPHGGFFLVLCALLPSAMIYNLIYDKFFLEEKIENISSRRIHIFFGQIVLWLTIIFIAGEVGHH